MTELRRKLKLVYGFGINDADYRLNITETIGHSSDGKQIQKLIWRCPFYVRWKVMLERCYSKNFQKRKHSYIGCTVSEDWLTFSKFKAWMETQDWEGKELDKDLLVPSNKVYSSSTCLFIDSKINLFIGEKSSIRFFPIGVTQLTPNSKYKAKCRIVNTGINKVIGSYDTAEEAHQAWGSFKLAQARLLAAEQTDTRIADALIKRYEKYA